MEHYVQSTCVQDKKHSQKGVAVIEAALTLLALFVLLFGIMESGRFLGVYQIATDAAVEGARFAITPVSGTSTLPSQAEISDKVKQKIEAGGIPTQDVTVNINQTLEQQYGVVPTQLTEVQVSVPYHVMSLAMFKDLSITIYSDALMRNETSQ
ncbi:MAG TPA: TadE/TadG family type IV pilus assembly protein [Acidobacteriota bacterium]|jgi:Flp pilus assembly protein TadG|nr:TadE/TadG family type IV pilus assembly protein [Acidobacteriota bacterium]